MMSVLDEECKIAFDKTVAAHPFAKIYFAKAMQVLERLNQKLASNYDKSDSERQSYGQLVRETLNEFRFPAHSDERKAYASLTGHYFGNRGTKNRALKAHRREPKLLPPVKIVVEGNQYTWDFKVSKTQ